MKYLLAVLFFAVSAAASDTYILFTSPNCVPCEGMKVALKEMNITWVRGEVRPNDGSGITTMPTLVVIDEGGHERKRIVGFTTKEELQKQLIIAPAVRVTGEHIVHTY